MSGLYVDKFASAVRFQIMAHRNGSAQVAAIESLQVDGASYWDTFKTSRVFFGAAISIWQVPTPYQRRRVAQVLPSLRMMMVASQAIASSGTAAATVQQK